MSKGLPRSTGRGVANVSPFVRKVRYVLNNKALAVTGGASTALGFGSATIGGLPEGNLLVLGALATLRFSSSDTDVINTWAGAFSVGTSATADTTLSAAEINIIPQATITAATLKVSPIVRATGLVTSTLASPFYLDNTDSTLNVILNMLTDDNSVTDSLVGDFLVNGFIDIALGVLGDD